jgi:nucleotide-binding universal stress UspA family protein
MKEINNVIVPTDFSRESMNALNTAINVCHRHDAKLILVHVSTFMVTVGMETNLLTGLCSPSIHTQSAVKLKRIMDRIKSQENIQVDMMQKSGDLTSAICMAVEEKSADLVVMGTHSRSGLPGLLMKPETGRVIKRCSCPVITVPEVSGWPEFRRILFPVRLIPSALEKYETIRPVIKKNNATLIVLGLNPSDLDHRDPELISFVRRFRKRLFDDDVSYDILYSFGKNLAEKVLMVAKQKFVDLIVINTDPGNRSRIPTTRSYAGWIVKKSSVPVMTLRSTAN